LFELIEGNIDEVRAPDNPNWTVAAVTVTKSQAKKPKKVSQLLVPSSNKSDTIVTKDELSKLQEEDETLKKFKNFKNVQIRKGHERRGAEFYIGRERRLEDKKRSGILYQTRKKVGLDSDILEQILVPQKLRMKVIS